jgi:glycosyltransferase involved in cell wall biosynthesis
MTAPLVTCGVTAFNADKTIERAIRSALTQSWRPIEIVVVDDASTDATLEILHTLAAKHPEIRVFRQQKNGGVADTRNRILSEARGEFVAFFDDDDESLPERVAEQVRRILAYERDFAEGAPVLCHTARQVIYPGGTARVERTMGERAGTRAPAGEAVARRFMLGSALRDGYGSCATCSQLARRSTYFGLGGFDTEFRRGEDSDLIMRAALAGGHFVGLSAALVVQNMTRTSEKSLADRYHYSVKFIEKHRSFLTDEQYATSRRWLDARYAFMDGRYLAAARMIGSIALRHPVSTLHRLGLALRNIGINYAVGRFYKARPE